MNTLLVTSDARYSILNLLIKPKLVTVQLFSGTSKKLVVEALFLFHIELLAN